MKRPSAPRHGLLALICDTIDADVPYFCLFAVSTTTAHQYGLWSESVRVVLSAAERAGLVSQPKEGFYLPTEDARAILARYPFTMVCEAGKPCQQCIRSGLAEVFNIRRDFLRPGHTHREFWGFPLL